MQFRIEKKSYKSRTAKFFWIKDNVKAKQGIIKRLQTSEKDCTISTSPEFKDI